MHVVLWILQIVVGLFFIFHTALLLRASPERARGRMKWMVEMPSGLRLFAAIAEGLAGVSIIFAPLIRDIDWLAPMAAAGLVLLMLGAIVFHLRRREYPNIGLNIVLGVLAAVIAWGRFGPYRFE